MEKCVLGAFRIHYLALSRWLDSVGTFQELFSQDPESMKEEGGNLPTGFLSHLASLG